MPSANSASDRRSLATGARGIVLLVALVGTLWLGGAVAAPALEASGHDRAAGWVRLAYAPLCHQIGGRCFTFAGGPVALCARCSGLYVGGLIGLVAGAAMSGRRRRWPPWVFFAGVAPTVAQWISVRFGVPEPGALIRFMVSIPAGFVCGWFLAHALGDLVEGAGSIREAAVARALRGRPGS